MFLLVLIFKTMKKTFIYSLAIFMMVSCKKDAEHQLQKDFPLPSTNVVNIEHTGVTFVGSFNHNGKVFVVDHGFEWSGGSRISLGALKDDKDFQTRITHNMRPNHSYSVKAYVATDNFVVYGNEIMFISLGSSPPIIERIRPAEITVFMQPLDITIYGKNFCSNKNDIKIISDAIIPCYNCSIISVAPDSVVVRLNNIIPGTNRFQLSILDKIMIVTFEAEGLIFENIEPQPAKIGSILSIKGQHFSNIQLFAFYNSDTYDKVEIVEKKDTEVKIKIPVLKEGLSKLFISDTKWNYYKLPIDILSPWKTVDYLDFFSPFSLSNTKFCNYQNKKYYIESTYTPTIIQFDFQNQTNQSITSIPNEFLLYGWRSYFMIGSKFYICTRADLFFCYDVETSSWEKLDSYTIISNDPILSFSIEDKGYVVARILNDDILFEYDSVIKIWKQIGSVRHIFNDFILNFPEWESTIYKNKAYISANGKIWEFNSEKYFFEEKYLGETGGSYLYTHNDMIYIVGRNNFIEYDPATNLIKQLPQHKHTLNTGPYIFFWKNFLYNYVYLNDDYKWEYIVFDLDLIEK